jgi:hypothetical protein
MYAILLLTVQGLLQYKKNISLLGYVYLVVMCNLRYLVIQHKSPFCLTSLESLSACCHSYTILLPYLISRRLRLPGAVSASWKNFLTTRCISFR